MGEEARKIVEARRCVEKIVDRALSRAKIFQFENLLRAFGHTALGGCVLIGDVA